MYTIKLQRIYIYTENEKPKQGFSADLYLNDQCIDVFEDTTKINALNKLFTFYKNLQNNLNDIRVQIL